MNCYYSRLNQEALLHIIGPDTLTFLQGQTSCDTRTIDESQAALGAYCTPQGRVVCDFLLLRLAHDHYALRMRRDIRRIQQLTGFTVVYVTHDQEEALEISDRIVIMEDGVIVAEGPPEAVKSHEFLTPLATEDEARP